MTNFGSESKRPGEFELIAEVFAPLATASGALRLSDDAAVLALQPGQELVITNDVIIEGVHFFASDPPHLIAQKALRVNLSDLAAKGSMPIGYLLTLCIAPWIDMEWLRAFAKGLAEDQGEFGVSLYGGDTTTTPGPLTISITAFGVIPVGSMVRRSRAQPGDLVFVTGTIGDGGGGLSCLKGEGPSLKKSDYDFLVGRFQRPEPRVALGRLLPGVASAALDVSDGLIADLAHIAETSLVRVVVDAAKVPQSAALAALWPDQQDRITHAVTSGDDYEIAFTVPPEKRNEPLDAGANSGTAVTEIGRCEAGNGVFLVDNNGREIPINHPGYVHF